MLSNSKSAYPDAGAQIEIPAAVTAVRAENDGKLDRRGPFKRPSTRLVDHAQADKGEGASATLKKRRHTGQPRGRICRRRVRFDSAIPTHNIARSAQIRDVWYFTTRDPTTNHRAINAVPITRT